MHQKVWFVCYLQFNGISFLSLLSVHEDSSSISYCFDGKSSAEKALDSNDASQGNHVILSCLVSLPRFLDESGGHISFGQHDGQPFASCKASPGCLDSDNVMQGCHVSFSCLVSLPRCLDESGGYISLWQHDGQPFSSCKASPGCLDSDNVVQSCHVRFSCLVRLPRCLDESGGYISFGHHFWEMLASRKSFPGCLNYDCCLRTVLGQQCCSNLRHFLAGQEPEI